MIGFFSAGLKKFKFSSVSTQNFTIACTSNLLAVLTLLDLAYLTFFDFNILFWNVSYLSFDKTNEKSIGCTTVNRVYITPLGDVLACPYVHIKIGNILEQPLKEIIEYGFSIKHFAEHSPICLAGENKEFVSKYMTKAGQSIFKPAHARDIFPKNDHIDHEKVKVYT